MLAAALYALDLAQSQDMAVADFQAGMLSGLKEYDLKSNFEACMEPDQDAYDEIEKIIGMVKNKDYSNIKSEIMTGFGPIYMQDMASCSQDPKVVEALTYQRDLILAAHSDSDWQQKAQKAILPHIK